LAGNPTRGEKNPQRWRHRRPDRLQPDGEKTQRAGAV
jgi:hypothetical protein